jgi:hypothetical protein
VLEIYPLFCFSTNHLAHSTSALHSGSCARLVNPESALLPLWLKLAYTGFLAVMIPNYALRAAAGLSNFLWFSDIALIVTGVALWLESSLLASMMAVAVLLPELLWNVSVASRVLVGRTVYGTGDYMFDSREHWHMRTLSLFHVFLPVVLVWLLFVLGYDERALVAQTLLSVVVFAVSYIVTDPRYNINRVFGPGSLPQSRLHPIGYVLLLILLWPLLVYVPTHFLLEALFGR